MLLQAPRLARLHVDGRSSQPACSKADIILHRCHVVYARIAERGVFDHDQAKNWVKTLPERGWFAYFRRHGPTEKFLDKSWTLPDIELQP